MTARVWHYNDPAKPADAIYIGRAIPRYELARSVWANPYRVNPDDPDTRGYAVTHYLAYALDMLNSHPDWLEPLRDHDLACWCKSKTRDRTRDLLCHGDVILAILAATSSGAVAVMRKGPPRQMFLHELYLRLVLVLGLEAYDIKRETR